MKNPLPSWKTRLQSLPSRFKNAWRHFRKQPKATTVRFLKAHKWSLTAVASLFLLIPITFYYAIYFGAFGELPTRTQLQQISNAEASVVYSADNKPIGRYYAYNRTNITYKELPPHLILALVATEDARFYRHNGVDWRSMPRVLWGIVTQQDLGGGSTIQQQLLKNVYGRQPYNRFISVPVNKCREMILAQRLMHVYNRDEILTLYFNTVPFGELVFGIEQAAYRYFGTSAQALNLNQAATLVGMLKATYTYNPYLNPEAALQRRNVVLKQMERRQYLTPDDYATLSAQPLNVDYHPKDPNEGLAPYFLQYIKQQVSDLLKPHTHPNGIPYDIERDGLRIYTTLLAPWQEAAQSAVHAQLAKTRPNYKAWRSAKAQRILTEAMHETERYKKMQAAGKTEAEIREYFNQPTETWVFNWGKNEQRTISPWDSMIHYKSLLRASFLVTEPQSGYIRAWVGGPNHQYLPFDHVTARRQAGSTFKPILYAAALESGETPCTYYPNEHHQYTEFGGWQPANANNEYGGWYTMHGGLTHSKNTIAARLMQKVNIDSTILYARQMGITSPIPNQPSIALGTASVDLLELATVYGTIANEGRKQPLQALLRIETKDGQTLYQAPKSIATDTVIQRSTALQLRAMLESVVDSGTARGLLNYFPHGQGIAGKTGTTQNLADARFVGFTPRLVGTVWVGGEYSSITQGVGSGGKMALPIWGNFYQTLLRNPNYRHYLYQDFPPLPEDLQYDCPMYTTDSTLVFPKRRPVIEFFERIINGKEPQRRARRPQKKKKKGFWKRLFGGN